MPKSYVKKIKSLLIANRGEIAIRIMRAASELGIRTVAVYTFEDRYSLHRYKADEAYQIGKENEPLKPYLDIECLISLCKSKKIDAIHPGYGFLSENVVLARRCREEYPYFDERYQERGKSFVNSDAAWLVTLTVLPPSQLLGQVEWLGRVLGNRGMPRITLERQLILLHMELTGAGLGQQEQGDQYAGLLEAAKALRVGRLRRISEERFNQLAQGFHAAVSQDKDTQGRLSRTGELLVSVVCDEAEGITHAVPSLLAWMTNQECFSQLWISEVLRTVEMARATLIGRA
jgi:hypothetical protein